MLRFVVRSLVTLMVSALAGSMIVFLLMRLLGGDIATVILGKDATPQALAELRTQLGLDLPWPVQYWDWLTGLMTLDLGQSYAAGYDIGGEIAERLPLTLALVLSSMVLSSIAALAVGTHAAIRRRSWLGRSIDVVVQVGIAIPTFWLALVLIGTFSIKFRWVPASGFTPFSENPLEGVRGLILPVIALSIPMTAVFVRYVKTAMTEVLEEDFIRTAIAKGRTLEQAAVRHGVRNASISLVTVGTLQLGSLLVGAVVVENVFVLPGLGSLLTTAIGAREAIVVQSVVFVIVLTVLLLNFLMDISYGLIDPRIRDAGR